MTESFLDGKIPNMPASSIERGSLHEFVIPDAAKLNAERLISKKINLYQNVGIRLYPSADNQRKHPEIKGHQLYVPLNKVLPKITIVSWSFAGDISDKAISGAAARLEPSDRFPNEEFEEVNVDFSSVERTLTLNRPKPTGQLLSKESYGVSNLTEGIYFTLIEGDIPQSPKLRLVLKTY